MSSTTIQDKPSNSETKVSPTPIKHKKKIRHPKPLNSNNEELEAICRICHETVDPSDLGVVRACRCRNYLHQNCYLEWFKTAQTTNCEICLTNYKIRTRKRLNKTQLKQNWCNFFYNILIMFLFLILTGVAYFMDLKYLVIPSANINFFYLNYMAMVLAFFASIYWIDGVFGFDRQQILQKDLIWLPLCHEDRQQSYISMMAFQIHAIIRPMSTNFSCDYFSGILVGSVIIVGILFLAYLIATIGATWMFILSMVLALFFQWIYFYYLINLKKTTILQNIRILSSIIGGQMLFHIIGMIILKSLPISVDWWLYMASQLQPNVFTYSIGGLTWVSGLIILAILIKLTIYLGHWVSWCCYPREIIPQLEPY